MKVFTLAIRWMQFVCDNLEIYCDKWVKTENLLLPKNTGFHFKQKFTFSVYIQSPGRTSWI